MSRFYDDFIYKAPSVSELRKKVGKTLSKGKEYNPVIVEPGSRKICKSWWGDAWCRNLERYADWSNRIGRGKTYIRNGSVVDLKITDGTINAKVQGSRSTPYTVKITIDPLPENKRIEIQNKTAGKIQNLEALVTGKFPDDLKEIFFGKDGLFPEPEEIHFNCSCPDWASLCKHIAAALFGTGIRLDENPMIFFRLRGIDLESFISAAVADKVEQMIENTNSTSPRIIKGDDLTEIFGIET